MSATILIIGANFINKGAQSMLFTTISTIRQKYPDSRIIFGHAKKTSVLNENFRFEEAYFNSNEFLFQNNNIRSKNELAEEMLHMLQNVDLIVDISGFSLGKKWGIDVSRKYLSNIALANVCNTPIILMPQSFGSFDFGVYQNEIDELMQNFMPYPLKIFAREHEGFNYLVNDYGLKNVKHHPDLVLCSQHVKLQDIYVNIPKFSVPIIAGKSCVAVIPNIRSFDRGAYPIQTLEVFYEIVKFLINEGKKVYLIRHSFEDIVPCRWIKALFPVDERVVLLENDFSCFEYDEVCKQFEFLIVGRFHGIVHGYRNNVPCILLGWAVKYRELAQLMYQNQYIFDITTPNFDIKQVLEAIKDMEINLNLNKNIIRERLSQLQAMNDCFSYVLRIIEKIERV